ncbi:MAG TPA: 30S ribosomal protein S4 [Thermomicrobiales bacterium]|nr:30S ribosomal protein S4 [Thermomicrobiales bacterium]
MARYTGPVCRICRREGMKLYLKGERCLGPKCPIVQRNPQRNFPPGMHGQKRTRRPSEFGLQWREKQKVRRFYGLMEKQFSKTFEDAVRQPGVTGENLLRMLEMRLDNVVYRLGFADSRRQARQIGRHGHFLVNGRKTDIPSYAAKPGDVISVKPQSRDKEYFKTVAEALKTRQAPDWLTLDVNAMSGRVVAPPTRDQIDMPPINESLIIEFYSR